MDTTLPILFEDNHAIAVFKAPGILTQGDRSGDLALIDTVRNYLKERYQKRGNVFLGLLHRLDRPCSGIVLFAKNSKSASRLCEQIRLRQVKKIYRVRVAGRIPSSEGEMADFMTTGRSGAILKPHAFPGGREARLRYRVLVSQGDEHLLEVELITGRKHQIRVQLAERGLPVLGDRRYGSKYPYSHGIALLSYRLCFFHPVKREEVITVTVPENLSLLARPYED